MLGLEAKNPKKSVSICPIRRIRSSIVSQFSKTETADSSLLIKMFHEFYQIATDLKAQGEPFAAVTVVRNEAPSSGKVGDKAIVSSQGVLQGWIGGGCVLPIVLKEVSESLLDGKPRLVRVSPSPTDVTVSGMKSYKMTCYSGGTVDLYIEPILPKPHLIILGKSIIGRALMKIAKAADYRITVVTSDAAPFAEADNVQTSSDLNKINFNASTFLVVATQGDNDEQALQMALSVNCRYVSFITSRKKKESVYQNLKQLGLTEAQLSVIRAPAGLDIHAKTPEEVAISILAEVIQVFRTQEVPKNLFEKPKTKPQMVTNPVCGMPISAGMAKHTLERDGQMVYFCCDGCKIKFDEDPDKYMANFKTDKPQYSGM
jgi:xanthine dehydrogenase accessory factor